MFYGILAIKKIYKLWNYGGVKGKKFGEICFRWKSRFLQIYYYINKSKPCFVSLTLSLMERVADNLVNCLFVDWIEPYYVSLEILSTW